jgi:type IV secretion system protein VirD4
MRKLWASLIHLMLLIAVAVILVDILILGLHYQALGMIALVGIAYRLCKRGWQVSSSYGSARVAGLNDLLAGNLLADRGLILGRVGNAARPTKGQALRSLLSPRGSSEWAVRLFSSAFFGTRAVDFIRIRDFVHLATFAPAGGGKSVSVLYPNLLSYAGNCVVNDPKGELYKLTAAHREKQFGHTIVRLDPAKLFGPGDSFNPFTFIDPTQPDFLEACRDLGNMLVVRTGKETDPHWLDSAENVIAAFIAYICALEGNPAARNLRGVREQLASRENYNNALSVMQSHDGFHGVLRQLSGSLSWHQDKELGSVMSTTQRFTNIFDSPQVTDSTSSTTFDPRKLRTGRMTIYLITPADRMVVWQGLTRLWLGSLLRVITQGRPTEKNPVLFLVDECSHLGKMKALEDAVTLMRGMGIRLWLFFQSIEQLKACYGDNAGTVLDNLATQQYMSINSYETAEAISKRIGDQTIVIRTEGTNHGTSSPTNGDGKTPGSRNSGRTSNMSELARRLLKPEEILVLPEHAAIVFHKNNYVIVCNKIKYYADQAFRRRGVIFRRWGTGRTPGLGLGGLMLGLIALAVAFAVTSVVVSLSQQGPGAAAPSGYQGGLGDSFGE